MAAVGSASNDAVVALLEAHQDLMAYTLRDRIRDRPITASGDGLAQYLVATLGDRRTELVRALYLDSGNRLLGDEQIAEGDAAGARPSIRTIIARALDFQAVAVVIVHNHPGGQREASPTDIEFTMRLVEAGRTMGVTLLDHIIVAGGECISLKARGVLP